MSRSFAITARGATVDITARPDGTSTLTVTSGDKKIIALNLDGDDLMELEATVRAARDWQWDRLHGAGKAKKAGNGG